MQHELVFATTADEKRTVHCACGHVETVVLEHGWSTTIQELDALDQATIRNHAG